jgi:signal transduction protein with GAF and PtsI domain
MPKNPLMTKSETDELKRELNFLYHVSQSVYSLELDELLSEIVSVVNEVTKADSCFIYTIDRNKNILILRASKNPHPKLLEKIHMKIGEGITGWVAEQREVVAIKDNAYLDKRFKLFNDLPEDSFAAFLSAPIISQRGVVGVINAQHKKSHQHSQMEINLLTAIGRLVGGAVENALLVEETLELKEALTVRKLIEKAKGILMQKKNITENEAYKLIQKQSMQLRISLREISEAIILADSIER